MPGRNIRQEKVVERTDALKWAREHLRFTVPTAKAVLLILRDDEQRKYLLTSAFETETRDIFIDVKRWLCLPLSEGDIAGLNKLSKKEMVGLGRRTRFVPELTYQPDMNVFWVLNQISHGRLYQQTMPGTHLGVNHPIDNPHDIAQLLGKPYGFDYTQQDTGIPARSHDTGSNDAASYIMQMHNERELRFRAMLFINSTLSAENCEKVLNDTTLMRMILTFADDKSTGQGTSEKIRQFLAFRLKRSWIVRDEKRGSSELIEVSESVLVRAVSKAELRKIVSSWSPDNPLLTSEVKAALAKPLPGPATAA